jgi:hypothetical protein
MLEGEEWEELRSFTLAQDTTKIKTTVADFIMTCLQEYVWGETFYKKSEAWLPLFLYFLLNHA